MSMLIKFIFKINKRKIKKMRPKNKSIKMLYVKQKLSLVTADYKHYRNQSSQLKPFTFLSPHRKTNEKANNLSDIRFKGDDENLKKRDCDQSKSINNLLIA
jgi:hypothetical protein